MSNIETELSELRASSKFKKGFRYFWLYNYSFFKILDEQEFKEYNQNCFIEGKKVFAAGSTNPDDDEYCLYYDTNTKAELYILANYKDWNKRGLKKISNSVSALFGNSKPIDNLILKDNKDFWYWSEAQHEGAEDEVPVPKGVLPAINLIKFFKNNLKDTLLFSRDNIDTNKLYAYFEEHGSKDLVPSDFFDTFSRIEQYLELVNTMNAELKANVFFATELNPSGYCGIGKYTSLTSDEIELADYYGLILPKT